MKAVDKRMEPGLEKQSALGPWAADWQRLVAWSDRIQAALGSADELGQELDSPCSLGICGLGNQFRQKKPVWRPTLAALRDLQASLEQASGRLEEVLAHGRKELRESDWQGTRPRAELVGAAGVLEAGDRPRLAEAPGPWSKGVPPAIQPLVASRLAVAGQSPMLHRRLVVIDFRLERVRALLEEHHRHAGILARVRTLLTGGQVESARMEFNQLPAVFGDLEYQETARELEQRERRLGKLKERLASEAGPFGSLDHETRAFFFFPPVGLSGRCAEAVRSVETALGEAKRFTVAGRESEEDRQLAGWISGAGRELERFRRQSLGRLRRWLWGTCLAWCLFGLGGLGALWEWKSRVAMERERGYAQELAKEQAEEEARRRLSPDASKSLARAQSGAGSRLELGLATRWVPPGWFTMGSPATEIGRDWDEVQHEVVLTRGFFLAETECSQAQWEAVMGTNPSQVKGPNHPVDKVSWEEAMEFCRRLTEKHRAEGLLPGDWAWRLPTEAEWEYAARAGTMQERHGDLDGIAWYQGNSSERIQPVGGKQPNAWGLHDMIGNVWEWCGDWFDEYPTRSVTDPAGPSSGSARVFRGGGWYYGARECRSAYRHGFEPGFHGSGLGFRPVLSPVR